MKYNIPELTFVYATEYSEAYVIKENGFRPMILLVDVLNKEFFINYHKYSYKEQSEITKAVYDFQNEHIEKGYKEDALIFRKLLKSNYKSIVEKMLNSLDEKKELFCDKVKYEGKADKTLEEKLGSKEYKKFIEHCEELCNRPLLPSDIFNFPNTKPTYEELEKSLQEHKDVLWKQFGVNLMYDAKWYRKTTYQPKQDNYFTSTDSYVKDTIDENESLGSIKVYKNPSEVILGKIIATLTPVKEGCSEAIWIDNKGNKTVITYYENGIKHIITPSKNYFLFKLS